MEQQIFNFIAQTLVHMNIAPEKIEEESDILFDLNLDIDHLDFLFSLLEKHFKLNTSLMFNRETATVKGLTNYVRHSVAVS